MTNLEREPFHEPLDTPGSASQTVDELAWDDPRNPAWLGIPREVRERAGAYDTDTAGGCG